MYSGISGMKNFQTKLDVVGNNIANVNTAGFKKGRIAFQDMLSQTSQGATAPGANRGGINPKQVGTGSKIGSIDTIHTQGFMQNTNETKDLMIQGDGMFVVQNGNEKLLTRSGNFSLDKNGDLVTADGYNVLDTAGQKINIPNGAKSLSIQQNGSVSYITDVNGTSTAVSNQKIGLFLVTNPGGLEKLGSNLYRTTANSGGAIGATLTEPGNGGAGEIISGALEMSNVDLSEEFTEMITAQRGFQANTRIITTSDEILQELVNLKR